MFHHIDQTLGIELPWSENLANTYARYTETLDSCYDLIRSPQCIPWSPPLEIKPVTTDCRAETLQLSQLFMLYISDAKLTIHGNCIANVSCKLHPYFLQRTWSPPEPRLPRRIRNTHPCNYYDLKGKDIDVYFYFLIVELYCELNYHDLNNPANTYAWHMETLDSWFHMSCVGICQIVLVIVI